MTQLTYQKQKLDLREDETVLDCFLRHDIEYPHSCKSGICQSCLIKASDGEIAPSWQEGMPEILKSQGYFLACRAKPLTQLKLASPDTVECEVEAIIQDIQFLTGNVLQMKLQLDDPRPWIPGQYLTLINDEQLSRSYSIANIPELDGFIELHIKITQGGAMSRWLQFASRINSTVRLRGPFGTCYYHNPDHLAFDMLLAGTGTGLAPLLAILRSALHQQHQGEITLIHGGCRDDDIYYIETLEALAKKHAHFHYSACVLEHSNRFIEMSIEEHMLSHISNPAAMCLYVCGPEETTNKLKMKAFMAGVPSASIFSDAFL